MNLDIKIGQKIWKMIMGMQRGKKKIRSLFLVDIGQVHVQYMVMFTVRHSWHITSDGLYKLRMYSWNINSYGISFLLLFLAFNIDSICRVLKTLGSCIEWPFRIYQNQWQTEITMQIISVWSFMFSLGTLASTTIQKYGG